MIRASILAAVALLLASGWPRAWRRPGAGMRGLEGVVAGHRLQRTSRGLPGRWTHRWRRSGAVPVTHHTTRSDIADLVGRLAALTRAGVPAGRAWQVLASGTGPGSVIAGTVAGMVAAGGSVAEGLRLAASGQPGVHAAPDALRVVRWLAVTSDVIERSGAPSAVVYDEIAGSILAELARLDEEDVALAGPRTTSTMLAVLPLAGLGLGLLMGANALAALTGSPLGRTCLVTGTAAWVVGRWWSRRLVASAARATS